MATPAAKKSAAPRSRSGRVVKPTKGEITKIEIDLARARRLRDAHDEDVVKLQNQLKALTEPQEPDTYADPPPVIRFKTSFPSAWSIYDYAALGRKGYWYLCQNGTKNPRSMNWQALLNFVGKDHWDTIEILG